MSRYDLPYEDFVRSMREMYAMAKVGHVPPYSFFAFTAHVASDPDERDELEGLVREAEDGRVDQVEDRQWITVLLDPGDLELNAIAEAERQATRLGVSLEDAPTRHGPAYYEFRFSDGTREGLIRRFTPGRIERLTPQGWKSVPGLERLFTIGTGGDQGDVAPVAPEEAKRRAMQNASK